MSVPTGRDDDRAILLSVGGLLHQEIAIDDLLVRLVGRLSETMDADRGTIYLVDRGAGEVVSRAAHLPELDEIRLRLGQGVAGHVAATGDTLSLPAASDDGRFFDGVDQETGYETRSILAVPMRDSRGEILGVVQLLNKRTGAFPASDAGVLQALAQQAAVAIEATTLYRDLMREPAADLPPVPIANQFNRVIGSSEPLRRACRLTSKAARSETTVLIRGESGTGKELFARAIHVNSPRAGGPFIKVDCASLPESLVENELFGHERGAYTGADRRTLGKFEAANGGTLFLDELGELPVAAQGKLLRVLQDGEFDRIGGIDPVRADVRVVAATNRNLERLVEDRGFRADLYYRVKVVQIELPPLRDRSKEDILRLAGHFARQAARRHGRPVPVFSPGALEQLAEYTWPGNVRELENCIESAIVLVDGDEITTDDLPLADRPGPSSGSGVQGIQTLEAVERAHIRAVLDHAGSNRTLAAQLLGIGRNTLTRKLKKYGMP